MVVSRNAREKIKVHYCVLIIIFLCGVVASTTIYLEESKYVRTAQKTAGVHFVEKMHVDLSKYALELSSISSLIQSSKVDILPEDFSRFIQNLSIPIDAGFYFAQYVPESKRYDYENKQKLVLSDDDFTIYPQEKRAEYLPLTLSYPDNLSYGYDILSSQYSRAASIKKVRVALGGSLFGPTKNTLSDNGAYAVDDIFILRMPIYLPVEARSYKLTDNNGFHGIIGAYFKVDSLFKPTVTSEKEDIIYRIADINDQGDTIWFKGVADTLIWQEGEYDTHSFYFSGREWRVDTRYSVGVNSFIHWDVVIWPLILFSLIGLFLFFYIKRLSSDYYSAHMLLNKRIETDELTGLLSRYQVQKVLTGLIESSDESSKSIAVFVLDLDHFKTINDAFGHEVGDKLLVRVGKRLNSILPDEAIIGYLGGDAFVVLLQNNQHDTQHINVIAKEMIQQISQSYFIDGRTLNIGCSIGVTMYPEFGQDAVTLIKNADMAVYKAKTLGRATYHFYDGEMGTQFARNMRIETRLRQALLHSAFELHFQPKVDIITECCVGMEALLRWKDEELGIVSPAEFIPIAEQTGLILALGEWVFEQAFRHIIEWQEQGISVPPIAINCSAAQLKRIDFLPNLLKLLDKYKVDPSLLEIEVTESILIEDAEGCAELLRQISRLGIKLAIDDFGTGYSSLSYLKDLPIDYIKIDQVFIRDITEDRNHAALTHAIIGLGHNLNLKVIAEGISNIDQLIMLQEFDCDIGQGYLFSKALGANSMGTDPMIVALNKKNCSD